MATMTEELLTLGDVLALLKCSRSSLYAWMEGRGAHSAFPRPIKVGVGNRWVLSEIEEWVAAQPRAVIQGD